jgi:hypothetical protein
VLFHFHCCYSAALFAVVAVVAVVVVVVVVAGVGLGKMARSIAGSPRDDPNATQMVEESKKAGQ